MSKLTQYFKVDFGGSLGVVRHQAEETRRAVTKEEAFRALESAMNILDTGLVRLAAAEAARAFAQLSLLSAQGKKS